MPPMLVIIPTDVDPASASLMSVGLDEQECRSIKVDAVPTGQRTATRSSVGVAARVRRLVLDEQGNPSVSGCLGQPAVKRGKRSSESHSENQVRRVVRAQVMAPPSGDDSGQVLASIVDPDWELVEQPQKSAGHCASLRRPRRSATRSPFATSSGQIAETATSSSRRRSRASSVATVASSSKHQAIVMLVSMTNTLTVGLLRPSRAPSRCLAGSRPARFEAQL